VTVNPTSLLIALIVLSLLLAQGVASGSLSNSLSQTGVSTAPLSGIVYDDNNGNLRQDQNETGISGWNVSLAKDGVVVASAVSDETGAFEFTELAEGNYLAYLESIPDAFIVTQPANHTHIVTIEGTGAGSDISFGAYKNTYQLISDVSFNADIFGFTVEGIALDKDGNLYHADALGKVVRKFSTNGTVLATIGNGSLSIPGGLAIDSSGNVFVAEKFGAIKKFDSNGNLVGTMNNTGRGDDQFESPRGITIDPDGNLYVADGGSHRIQVFDGDGKYKSTIGSVIPPESTSDLPKFRKGNPELPWSYLHLPFDAKVDTQGNIWVADTVNNRVQKFDSDGNFLLNIGKSSGDRPGPQEGSFNRPRALAVGPDDSVYVADTYYSRIQVFDNDGKFIRTFGSLGDGLGQFANPSGIEVDRESGVVYVVDSGNARIQSFSADGKPLSEFPTRTVSMEPYFSYIDPSGHLLASDNAEHKIHRFDVNTGEHLGEFGGVGSEPGKFRGPRSIAVDSEGNVWVADNYNNRVQKVDSEGNSLLTIGKLGSADGQFRQPRGLVVDSNDNILVSDTQNNRIQKFDSEGKFLDSFTTPSMLQPYQIALDKDGNIYVAEAGSKSIEKLDITGKSLLVFGGNGTGPGKFVEPRGVNVDSAGNIYTSDQSNRIQKFGPDGTFVSQFGRWGSDKGEFFNPRGIFIDAADNLWVSDTQNERLQMFDKEGKFVKEIRYSP
jgi:sugar lactone lactonase YvrE